MTPTQDQARAYEAMYDHFNRELFGGELNPVILNFSRRAKCMGFFAPKRWTDRKGKHQHEISLNPLYVKESEPMEVAQTLVHEMCHAWQEQCGDPGRPGYHNREWADKMESIGLMPSSTGAPGGKRTGQSMGDYPIEGGLFESAFKRLPKRAWFPWTSREEETPKLPSKKTKIKYTCPECRVNVWGKPDLLIGCIECEVVFVQINP